MEIANEDIINSIEDGVVVFDTEKKITLFNQMSEVLTGISQKKALNADSGDVFASNGQLISLLEKTLETGQVFSDYDTNLLRKDASIIPVSLVTSPILSAKGDVKGVTALIRDISRIKSLEEDVRRSDSLASVGVLAAGLAHEIKNPLGGIRGAAQLLQMEIEGDEELKSCTDIIIKETDRVSRLLEDLLDFSNPRKLTLGELNVHEVLDSVIALISRSAEGEGVNFISEYDPSIPLIIGDREKLAQVFINIMKNGCEAMKGEGELKIVTRVVSDFLLQEGEGVRSRVMAVEVADSGEGIEPDNISKLFTPFFTAKKGGTGLGLSVSHSIVKEHKGTIKVKSEHGEGSVFSVFLPLR